MSDDSGGTSPDDRRRKTRMPPGYQRQMLVMAISGLSLIVVLSLIGLLLHFVG